MTQTHTHKVKHEHYDHTCALHKNVTMHSSHISLVDASWGLDVDGTGVPLPGGESEEDTDKRGRVNASLTSASYE